MLADEKTMFSEISLAITDSHLTNRIEDFKKFDFKKIYSDGYYNGEHLTPYRNAELVIPHEWDLKYLKHIWCRSNAEYLSLCYLLKENDIYDQYIDLIGVKENNNDLFFKNSIYISKVNLTENKVNVVYKNVNQLTGSEMMLKYNLIVNDKVYTSERKINHLREVYNITFANKIENEIQKK